MDGKTQTQESVLYNLDVIISVGYRVKSKRGTAFRIWARKVLKDYLVKGYAVNERIRREQIGELRLIKDLHQIIDQARGHVAAMANFEMAKNM